MKREFERKRAGCKAAEKSLRSQHEEKPSKRKKTCAATTSSADTPMFPAASASSSDAPILSKKPLVKDKFVAKDVFIGGGESQKGQKAMRSALNGLRRDYEIYMGRNLAKAPPDLVHVGKQRVEWGQLLAQAPSAFEKMFRHQGHVGSFTIQIEYFFDF